MRSLLRHGLVITLVALSGCKITGTPECLDLESGCGPHLGQGPDGMRVVGFPVMSVDSLSQGTLHVGETVMLRLVTFSAGGVDTSRTAAWSLPGTITSARITQGANGVGQLEAIAPGTIDLVTVDGLPSPIWWCDASLCARLTRVVIVP